MKLTAPMSIRWTKEEKKELTKAANRNGFSAVSPFIRFFWKRHRFCDHAIPTVKRRIKNNEI